MELSPKCEGPANSLTAERQLPTASEKSALFDFYLDAQEDERLRMGRELHDSTGQLLLALTLELSSLRRAPSSEQTMILDEINRTVGQIDREIRTFAFLHYPTELDDRGLVAALEALTRGFRSRTGICATFQGCCKQPIANSVALAFLRVAQEALTNIHRHAHATLAKLSLVEHDRSLELSIADNGIGIAPAVKHDGAGGIGIAGMRHRIEKLGGHFAIRRLKPGTKIVACLPYLQLAPQQA
jgi:two-component system NarL family sensor kinase